MSRDDDILDYLLGEADPEIVGSLEELAEDDPALADELEGLAAVVGALDAMPADGWNDVPVPALPGLPAVTALREVTPADLADEGAPDGGVVVPLRRRVAMPRFAAVAASLGLLAAGFGGGALVFSGSDAPPVARGEVIQLASFDQGGPEAFGEVRPLATEDGGLTLDVSGLDPSRPGEIYTLWLIDPDSTLLNLGSFLVPEEGATTVTVPLPVDLADFWAVDVSIEPAKGDPGHSGKSVLRGEIQGDLA